MGQCFVSDNDCFVCDNDCFVWDHDCFCMEVLLVIRCLLKHSGLFWEGVWGEEGGMCREDADWSERGRGCLIALQRCRHLLYFS